MRTIAALVGPIPLALLYHANHSVGRHAGLLTEYAVAALSFWLAMLLRFVGCKLAGKLLRGRDILSAAVAAAFATLLVTTALVGWSSPLSAPFWFSLAIEFWGIFAGMIVFDLIRSGRVLGTRRAGT